MNKMIRLIYNTIYKDKPTKSYWLRNIDTGEIIEITEEQFSYINKDRRKKFFEKNKSLIIVAIAVFAIWLADLVLLFRVLHY